MGVTVIYWRDIPSQVVAGQGRAATRILLPERFQEAIDRAATRAGRTDSDDYMAEWHKVTVELDDPVTVADQLDADHPAPRLEEMVRIGGRRSP